MGFYTGFPNCSTFLAVLNYLNPGDEGENVAYWLSQSNVSVPAELYDESEVEPSRKLGRPRNLRASPMETGCRGKSPSDRRKTVCERLSEYTARYS